MTLTFPSYLSEGKDDNVSEDWKLRAKSDLKVPVAFCLFF